MHNRMSCVPASALDINKANHCMFCQHLCSNSNSQIGCYTCETTRFSIYLLVKAQLVSQATPDQVVFMQALLLMGRQVKHQHQHPSAEVRRVLLTQA